MWIIGNFITSIEIRFFPILNNYLCIKCNVWKWFIFNAVQPTVQMAKTMKNGCSINKNCFPFHISINKGYIIIWYNMLLWTFIINNVSKILCLLHVRSKWVIPDIIQIGYNFIRRSLFYDFNMESNTWQNLYHTPYQPETPISARGPKARGLILVEGWFGCDTDFDMYCCFYYIFE